MVNLAELFKEYEKSPCYECAMTASLHAHTPEEAKTFIFGCEGEKLKQCRNQRIELMRGPKDIAGNDGQGIENAKAEHG